MSCHHKLGLSKTLLSKSSSDQTPLELNEHVVNRKSTNTKMSHVWLIHVCEQSETYLQHTSMERKVTKSETRFFSAFIHILIRNLSYKI